MLDNEAVQALAQPHHPRHRHLLAVLEAGFLRGGHPSTAAAIVTPTPVRLEAGLARAAHANLGRFRVGDVGLTTARTDRCIAVRAAAGGSLVDASVAQAAEEHADTGRRVTVFTSDLTDLPGLVAAGSHPDRVAVRRI